MTYNITDKNPSVEQVAPVAAKDAGELTNPPRSPLQSPDPKIRRAWQVALFNMRKHRLARL